MNIIQQESLASNYFSAWGKENTDIYDIIMSFVHLCFILGSVEVQLHEIKPSILHLIFASSHIYVS